MRAKTESQTVDSEVVNQVAEIAQQCLQNNPAVILGSGISVPHGLPSMKQLACKLAASVPGGKLSSADNKHWQEFVALLETEGNLESALQQRSLPGNLLAHVAKQVWSSVSDADLRVFEGLVSNDSQLPLGKLFRHLFDSSNDTLSVVTTNYDRVAEYAADQEGYYHDTGLGPGYLRLHQTGPRPYFIQGQGRHPSRIRTVNIWKVHGCLGWFRKESREIIGVSPSRMMPKGCLPAIIMPGREKYQHVLQEPIRSILSGADDALTRARAYLCVGFGFNDEHIQPKLEVLSNPDMSLSRAGGSQG